MNEKKKKKIFKSAKHRCIYLLEIAGKILAKILLNLLSIHIDQTKLIPESQCGFSKATISIKMPKKNVDLYMTCVDLTEAFDTVSRDGVLKTVAKFGCPPRFIAMVRKFQDGIQASVQHGGEFSEPFHVTNECFGGSIAVLSLSAARREINQVFINLPRL